MATTVDSPAASGDIRTNSDLVERFIQDVWNGEDLDAIATYTTDDVVVHGLGAGVDRTGEEFRKFHAGLLAAVPDLTHEIEDIVVDGDDLVTYVRLRGTPEKQYGALSPTGRSFDSVGFQKYRVEDGLIAEVWVLPNAMGMLKQLGIFPDGPGDVLRLMYRAIKGRVLGR